MNLLQHDAGLMCPLFRAGVVDWSRSLLKPDDIRVARPGLLVLRVGALAEDALDLPIGTSIAQAVDPVAGRDWVLILSQPKSV